jgi:hypothetical protein
VIRDIRKNQFRALSGAALALALFVGAAPAVAADAGDTACRQEVRRVAVWPHGPKAAQTPRYENREVTVCNGKVVSQKSQRNASAAEKS